MISFRTFFTYGLFSKIYSTSLFSLFLFIFEVYSETLYRIDQNIICFYGMTKINPIITDFSNWSFPRNFLCINHHFVRRNSSFSLQSCYVFQQITYRFHWKFYSKILLLSTVFVSEEIYINWPWSIVDITSSIFDPKLMFFFQFF